jgi:hypothetical protein
MRTLLITNSYDVTSDILINNLGAASFIRLNFDLPRDWSITLTPFDLNISSIHGVFNSDNISKCIWRKPFISKPEDYSFCEKFTQEEWKYTLYEIVLLMQDQGKLYMNFPFADYEVGKLKQQRHAKRFFKLSKATVYANAKPVTSEPTIAKSLSGQTLSDGRVLYTTEVTSKELSKDVWYIQDLIEAKFDLTVVYLYGEIFTFRLDRSKISALDWRKDQFEIVKEWDKVLLGHEFEACVKGFMSEMGLVYGRLDFLQPEVDDEPVFLEVNKNGQWAWLDPEKNNGLFAAMCKIYNPIEK